MSIFRTNSSVIPYTISKASTFNCYIAVDCDKVTILGKNYQIRLYYKNISAPTINLVNFAIEVILPKKYIKMETSSILKILVEKLYDKIAEQELEKVMEKTRLMLGFAPEDYCLQRLANGKMTFHSTEEKQIVLNPDIIKYDKEKIEYMVLHEFCHLKYKIHSKGFWQMLKTYMPNYEKYTLEV